MAVSYQCCFCGQPVEAVDAHAVRIALTNLWQGDAAQGLEAHAECAAKAFPDRAIFDPRNLID